MDHKIYTFADEKKGFLPLKIKFHMNFIKGVSEYF